MRVKTSITLSQETLKALERVGGKGANRSRVVEEAIVFYLAERARAAREARDRAILDRSADDLNDEVADALAFQASL